MLHWILLSLVIISLILPLISIHYFRQLLTFIRVRRAGILSAGALLMLSGYFFFMLPWIVIEEGIEIVRVFSYIVVTSGLIILLGGIIRIYMDWKEAIR
ncbi:MAG: hypothetical protein J7K61_02090 [Thermoplasmata archaeon]|nr:hypothetical protein [Thermoplasmata archaeon]